MGGNTINLNKLPILYSAETWQTWSEAVITYLRSQGVYRYVLGSVPYPVAPDSGPATNTMREYQRDVQAYEDANEKAMGIICSAVSPGIRHEIVKKEKASEMWKVLTEKYDVVASVQSFEGLQTAITT